VVLWHGNHTTCPCPCQQVNCCARDAYFGKIDFSRILKEAEQLFYLCFQYLAFIFGLSCHHEVHWVWLIDSCGRGTWHAVSRFRACDVHFRHILRLVSNVIKIVTRGPYIVTQFLNWLYFLIGCMHSSRIVMCVQIHRWTCGTIESGDLNILFPLVFLRSSRDSEWEWDWESSSSAVLAGVK
jgi:hypothetical protein